MPDVVIVGGGVIGAACAYELASRGAAVTLFEKDALAAGASGRNLGMLSPPGDPVLDPLERASVDMYLEATTDPPVPVHLDREPIGTLTIAVEENEVADVRDEAAAAESAGVRVERLDPDALRAAEPEVTPDVLEAWLLHAGRRVDPGALTVCLAHLARAHGATVLHHRPVRSLLSHGDRVRGVATDDGAVSADVVIVAAGPWSPALLRPLGIRLAVAGARGWLVHLSPGRPLLRHWLERAARTMFRMGVEPITAADFAAGRIEADLGPIVQPSPDGTILVGSSREPALTAGPVGLDVPRRLADAAIRIVPALAAAPVIATWSGVRPMSPDERPLIGWVREGLLVATGHGSEGVILGGATAIQAAAMVAGEPPPFEPAPFDPLRFER